MSELWLFICRCVLPDTNKGRDKFTFFIPNYPNSTLICQSYLVYHYHLSAASFINKQVKSTCCYCFTSICNWWYQEELGFCCREAEPCKTIYGRVCVYMCVQWGCPGRGVWGDVHNAEPEADTPPIREQNNWKTDVKTLPCPKLRLRAVMINHSWRIFPNNMNNRSIQNPDFINGFVSGCDNQCRHWKLIRKTADLYPCPCHKLKIDNL